MWNVKDFETPDLDLNEDDELLEDDRTWDADMYDNEGLEDLYGDDDMNERMEEFPEEAKPEEEKVVNTSPSYIIQYVRKKNREKKGVFLAVKTDEDEVIIGWSLCCPLNVFDKYFGQELAYDRGFKKFDDEEHFTKVPPSILPDLDKFIERCKRYFKGCEFPAWTM